MPNDDPYEQMHLPFPTADELLRDAEPTQSARPIAAGTGNYELVDISELNDTEPDVPVGRAAILSVIPTSTTNPQRPRTVAAGYDHHRKTLSVVFRDGTLWNYYEVSMATWNNFKRAPSKGVFIATRLDGRGPGTMGPAEANDEVQTMAEALMNFSRRIQQGGVGGHRVGYQFSGKDYSTFKPFGKKSIYSGPKPTWSQRRYREEIHRMMQEGLNATDAVKAARKNLERRTRG